MKRLFKVGKEYFEKKSDAKVYRNELENYTPVRDKDGKFPNHKWNTKSNEAQIIGKE